MKRERALLENQVYSWWFHVHWPYFFFPMVLAAQSRAVASSFLRFFEITFRHTTGGRTPLYEWSARRRDLYLTTHDTHNRQTSMPPGGIRTRNPSKRAAADPRLRPRGHWDWLSGRIPQRIEVTRPFGKHCLGPQKFYLYLGWTPK